MIRTPEEEILDRKDVTARQRQDFEDQQNELMGNDTGRQARFFTGENSRAARIKKEREDRAFRDALTLLLQDPEYRALYEELGSRLASAEIEADTVIADLEATLQDLDAQISDMEARAAKGPDGNPVFKLDNGRVVNANGEDLPPEIADGIIWPSNGPSGDDYFDIKARRSDNADLLSRWQDYRHDTLGGIRDRHDDRDNPMTKGAMRDALDKIEDLRPAQASVTPNELEVSINAPAPNNFPSFGN